MSNAVFTNAFRFIGLILVQVLILKRISAGWEGFLYINLIIYPVFILLLPFRTPQPAILLLAFAMGITVDLFYDSPGVHASALLFMAFARPIVLKAIAPRGGYNMNHSPTRKRMGFPWFLRYASILIFCHIIFYFSVEAFTFVYIVDILRKTIFSYIFSMLFVLSLLFIFNPLD